MEIGGSTVYSLTPVTTVSSIYSPSVRGSFVTSILSLVPRVCGLECEKGVRGCVSGPSPSFVPSLSTNGLSLLRSLFPGRESCTRSTGTETTESRPSTVRECDLEGYV